MTFDAKEIHEVIEGALNSLDQGRYERARTDALIAIAETLFNIMVYQYPINIAIHQSMKDDLLKGEQ